jgi:hypothetical protein
MNIGELTFRYLDYNDTMGPISFESPDEKIPHAERRASFDLAQYLVKIGITKDKNRANYLLLAIALCAAIAAAIVWHTDAPVKIAPPEGETSGLYHP